MAKRGKLPEPIGLTELISQVRTDLQAAQAEGESHDLKFKVEAVDLELKVTAKRSAEGKAGIEIWVLSAGGSGKAESENVQHIKVRLVPERAVPGPDGNREYQISESTSEVPR